MKTKNLLIFILILLLAFSLFTIYKLNQRVSKLEYNIEAIPVSLDSLQNNRRLEANIEPVKSPITPVVSNENVENHTIGLFEKAAPSVTFITTTTYQRDFWTRDVMEIPLGTGSGFIWDTDGHIVTNYHVVKGSKKAVVTLADGSSYEAELVGVAPEKDLAVLKIDAPEEELTPIPVGKSYNLKVGQAVYAIGNPFGLDQTLTTGIISALGREIESPARIPIRDVIQTDAAINPGNSGGPLLNSSGQLIGVNTAIYSPSGAYAGIGFSIPAEVVNWVVPDIIQYGKVKRPLIGIEMASSQFMQQLGLEGAMVFNVVPGSPAEKAGLQPLKRNRKGDIIVGLNGKKIKENLDLILGLEKYKPGDQITLQVIRDDKEMDINILLDVQK